MGGKNPSLIDAEQDRKIYFLVKILENLVFKKMQISMTFLLCIEQYD